MLLKFASLRQVDLAGCIVSAAVVAAAYGFGFQPLFGAMVERANIELSLRNAQQLNHDSGEAIGRLQRTITTLNEQLSGVHRLADRTQVNHTISLVTERALLAGLIVESGTAEDPVEADMYAVVPISISGSGEFIATTNFIRELTDNHADIEVRSFTLDSASSMSSGTSGFSIELAWYVLPG